MKPLLSCSFLFFSRHFFGSYAQNPRDSCSNALIAIANGQHQAVDTTDATNDNVNGGACDGITIGETPGVWFAFLGTGQTIRASTCHADTKIKVKITLFSSTDGTCNTLVCKGVSLEPDFECPLSTLSSQTDSDRSWSSPSTKIDFASVKDTKYYLLVQQLTPGDAGKVMMSFRATKIPQNDECVDAIGPVPRDGTLTSVTMRDSSISTPLAGYCSGQQAAYPGVWYQFFGNGKNVDLSACAANNIDGFSFSVYEAADCSDLKCVADVLFEKTEEHTYCGFGTKQIGDDPDTSSYVMRDRFKASVPTKDGYRYYVYVHYAKTEQDTVVTSDLRFFINDGDGSGPETKFGPSAIKYRDSQYGMGPYKPGSKNAKNFYEDANGKIVSPGGSGEGSSQQWDRVAAMSSFMSFAMLFM
eukprot:scaffold8114_cov126-Cylindrotheca_fusiformis.AAC.5